VKYVYAFPEKTIMKEKARFFESIYYPLIFLVIIWGIKITEILSGLSMVKLGIYPRDASGMTGILFAPLVHGSLSHLFSNSGPLLILGSTVFYFYKPVTFRVIFHSWFTTGIIVWLSGREAYHIGASGLIYAMASFLFFSGFIRRSLELIAISFIVVFLYGGMIWGILPLREGVSWESHLMGGIVGLVLAVLYRRHGPQRKRYKWEEEDEEDEEDEVEMQQ
jgi:membrane associated rhomboid family serine protease